MNLPYVYKDFAAEHTLKYRKEYFSLSSLNHHFCQKICGHNLPQVYFIKVCET